MSLYQKSQVINNISELKLDSRIGKALMSMKGTSPYMGEWVSVKPGHSPVILDYRYYRQGDPVKDIDWKLSARTEKIFIKIREGYRQTDFLIVIDNSPSMKTSYSNSGHSKFIYALTIAYIIGKFALKSRDKLFLLVSGEKIRVENEQSLIDIIVDIEFRNSNKKGEKFWESDFDTASNIFVLSDFFVELGISKEFMSRLSHATKNLFFLLIQDVNEAEFNFSGRYLFIDPESQRKILTESKGISTKYLDLYKKHFMDISKQCKSYGAKIGKVLTTDDPLNSFIKAVS